MVGLIVATLYIAVAVVFNGADTPAALEATLGLLWAWHWIFGVITCILIAMGWKGQGALTPVLLLFGVYAAMDGHFAIGVALYGVGLALQLLNLVLSSKS
jgi:hypothetical protein